MITGMSREMFWGQETVFGNAGAGFPATGTTVHQAFNPCEGTIKLPHPYYENEMVATSESLDSNINYCYSSALAPGKASFPSEKGMVYHDPFLHCSTVFTHKAKSGTWAGGAGTYGKITADFTAHNKVNTIMMQYKLLDDAGTTAETKTLLGMVATEWRLGFKVGGVLREYYDWLVANQINNTRAFSAVVAFDDGVWADWAKSTYYPATACKVYWDNSHAAEFTDLNIEEAWFIASVPKKFLVHAGSLVPFAVVHDNREFTAEISSHVKGMTEVAELDSLLSAKSKKDLRLQWDTTANETKFLDITNAFVDKIDAKQVPSAKENYKVTLTFRGTTMDYEGNFLNLTDPSTRLNS